VDAAELAAKKLEAVALTICALAALHEADNDATYQRYVNFVKRKFPDHPVEVVMPGRRRMVVAAAIVKDLAMMRMVELIKALGEEGDVFEVLLVEFRRRGPSKPGPNGHSGGEPGT